MTNVFDLVFELIISGAEDVWRYMRAKDGDTRYGILVAFIAVSLFCISGYVAFKYPSTLTYGFSVASLVLFAIVGVKIRSR
jgi:hypothetical protein